MGDGNALSSEGVGDVELLLKMPNGKTKKRVMHSVLYVPGLACNQFSVYPGLPKLLPLEGKLAICTSRTVSRQRALVASDGNEML